MRKRIMEKILWTNNELKKIRPILKKFNLKLNNDNSISKLIFDEDNLTFAFFHYNELDDLNTLLFYPNKEDISKVLKQVIGIKYLTKQNITNNFFNGFIMNLSKINPLDDTEIFTIFVEILSLYKQTSYNYAKIIIENLKEPELIIDKINEIKNSNIETKEELYIKNFINKKLAFTNGIDNSIIFKPMIEKYNSNIKKNLLLDLNRRLQFLLKNRTFEKNKVNDSYEAELILKNRSKHVRRSYNERNYMD